MKPYNRHERRAPGTDRRRVTSWPLACAGLLVVHDTEGEFDGDVLIGLGEPGGNVVAITTLAPREALRVADELKAHARAALGPKATGR